MLASRKMENSRPLYNSRIFQSYIDYLRMAHPDLNSREFLDYAGITPEELADTAHWFTQEQADRFYQIIAEKSGDEDIARKAGRFSASSAGMASFQHYVIGLLNTETALLSMAKIFPLFTKGATVKAKRLAPGKIEIVSTPKPDVHEKPYQCENRMGSIEALQKLFTNAYGHIEHPSCFHKGDEACHYIVSWVDPRSLKIKLMRNYALIVSLMLLALFYIFLPTGSFLFLGIFFICLNIALEIAYTHTKIKELEKIVEHSHLAAEERIEMAHTSYNNSLLVQEIGQATAEILNVDDLMHKLADLMYQRLGFDRGLILLADEAETRLVFKAGYGYSEEEQTYLEKTTFDLNKPDSRGFFVRSFLDKKNLTISDANEMADSLSAKSRNLVETFGVRSLLCIPIIYKDKALGILAVDNVNSKTPLKKSDVNLLEGIASHIAIGINNARSFQRLKQSEDRYRQTLESIEEGYFEIDLNRQLLFANKAFEEFVGLASGELGTNGFEHFFRPGSIAELERLLKQILDSKDPVRFAQLDLATDKGDTLPVDISISLIVDQNGQPTGYRGFLRDARDRLKLEMEHKDLEYKLQRAQKMESIGTLAGGIAHNFNNWLGGILGNISLIKMAVQGHGKVLERISKIEHIVDNAAKMNRQLLSYARGGNYEIKPTDLNEMIQEVSETFAATKKDVVVKLLLDSDLGTVEADRSQIEQVLWNLYANATDAMPNGGVFIISTANVTSETIKGRFPNIPSGNYVRLSCADTGSGILTEHMDTIFEPFFTTKKSKGTGLGLASCYGIVKAHSGFIDFVSQVGVGSTFSIYLPSVDAIPVVNGTTSSSIQKGQGTILVVDDEEIILESSIALLSGLGYVAVGAASGEEVLDKYSNELNALDAVIIDMVMPGMSGGELYARLKRIRPDLKVLLCSGYSVNENIQAVLDQGCQGFLQKPFSLDQLSTAIRKLLADGHVAPVQK